MNMSDFPVCLYAHLFAIVNQGCSIVLFYLGLYIDRNSCYEAHGVDFCSRGQAEAVHNQFRSFSSSVMASFGALIFHSLLCCLS
jgi:hypothetical protein